MKVAGAKVVLFLSLGGITHLSKAWDVDPRCPPEMRRALEIQDEESWRNSSHPMSENEATTSKSVRALRGSTAHTANIMSRAGIGLRVFSLKMYWEEGFCWQEEYSRHRRWCWQCKEGCKEGGTLWWQKCSDESDQKFTYLPDAEGGRFKTAYHDLCLHRVSTTQYALKQCSSDEAQVIVGLRLDENPFELSPLGDLSLCINQDHHPKPDEIVENTSCEIARHWKTNLMELYDIENQVRLREEECSSQIPCGRCQGDCDDDEQCLGADLVCFQRIDATADSPVPGCIGDTVTNLDYCITRDMAGLSPIPPAPSPAPNSETDNDDQLRLREEECSSQSPCDRCQGDCDDDDQCVGVDLVCFQRIDGTADSPVPGCMGDAVADRDYCITRDMTGSPPHSLAPSTAINGTAVLDNQLRLREDECSSQSPCDRCQGDCDDDDQCLGADLVCFQRIGATMDSPVPGCKGDAVGDRDYCIARGMTESLRLREDECSSQSPCDRCQGDCDDDDQCLGADLVCFQRIGATMDSPVPGCTGDAVTDRDYCVARDVAGSAASTPAPAPISPNDSLPLNTYIRTCSPTMRCNRCEGDCDSDEDCMPGLKCFQKDDPGEIPGCIGRDRSMTDYCYLA